MLDSISRSIKRAFLNNSFIIALIIVNAVILFIEGFDIGESWLNAIILIDNFITVLFALEVVIKMRHYGAKKYLSERWNQLDTILVLISIPVPIAYLFGVSTANLSALLALRLLRLFRLFKFMRFVPEIDRLISGVGRAAKASVVIFLGFFLYTFILGIISFYLFSDVGEEFFGNPLSSIYSIFRIFTIEGWFEIPDAIAVSYDAAGTVLTYLYFTFVLFSGGIIGLSLINSIFVEEMLSDNTNDLEDQIDRLEKKIDTLVEAQTKNSG